MYGLKIVAIQEIPEQSLITMKSLAIRIKNLIVPDADPINKWHTAQAVKDAASMARDNTHSLRQNITNALIGAAVAGG